MDDRSLKALDFYPLLEVLKEFSTSPLGRKRCEALRPSADLEWIQARLAEVMEMKALLETEGKLEVALDRLDRDAVDHVLGRRRTEKEVAAVPAYGASQQRGREGVARPIQAVGIRERGAIGVHSDGVERTGQADRQ